MQLIWLLILFVTFTATADAGPACDALAVRAMACTTLDLSAVSQCIRMAVEKNQCLVTEGKDAESVAVQPAVDNYLAQRIAEHKRLYGQ
jgi:hypothetical protein